MRGALGGLAVLILVLLGAGVVPAQAADELGLSADGQTWSNHLDGPLFDSAARWAPGDVRQAHFYVRNQAADEGTLTVAVETRNAQRLLRHDRIQLSARVGSDPWVDLAPDGQAIRLNGAALPADSVRRVKVRAHFDFGSGNDSQRLRAKWRFRVTLSGVDSDPGEGPTEPTGPVDPGGDDQDQAGGLPNAGAPAVGWWIVVGATAVGVGLALMRGRFGKERQHGTP